jgi:hypothetical protein
MVVALLTTLRTRLLPALVTAVGVMLVTAGLLSYANPATAGTAVVESPSIETLAPTDEPTATIEVPSASLDPSADPSAMASAEPTAEPTEKPAGRAVATRVVIPALKIDLPIVKGNSSYPYCNVAMYLTTETATQADSFGQPGEGRATYLYAHARDGMFGPIYELAIPGRNGKKMLGMVVQVYTSDDRLYLYEIREVRLHQLDLDDALGATSEELWLQTSEGPKGTPGKTQLRALPISVGDADPKDAHPKAKPVACG